MQWHHTLDIASHHKTNTFEHVSRMTIVACVDGICHSGWFCTLPRPYGRDYQPSCVVSGSGGSRIGLGTHGRGVAEITISNLVRVQYFIYFIVLIPTYVLPIGL